MVAETEVNWLKDQVVDLQSQLAFQEDTIQALNDVVIRQQQQLDSFKEMLDGHKSQIEQLSAEGEVSNERPPHY
ncbi:MAG: SlyX protein [Gammaproteobacteria bacterium]|jgi:SlyX protein